MRRTERPGTTSARIARSVSTSLGIISRSAVARRHGKSMYLQLGFRGLGVRNLG